MVHNSNFGARIRMIMTQCFLIATALLSCAVSASGSGGRLIAAAPPGRPDHNLGAASISGTRSGFIAVWPVEAAAGPRTDGVALDAEGRRPADISRTVHVGSSRSTVMRFGATSLLVYWDRRNYSHFVTLADDGATGEELYFGEAASRAAFVVGSTGGTRLLIVTFEIGRIFGTLVDGAGAVMRENIFLARDSQEIGRIIPLANEFLIVRTSSSGGRVHRLRDDGELRDEELTIDPTGRTGTFGLTVGAASSSGDMLVVWQSDPRETTTTVQGALLGKETVTAPFEILRLEGSFSVPHKLFWNRDHYVLIVTQSESSNFTGQRIYAIRLAADGTQIGSPVLVDPPGETRWFSDTAFNGGSFYVTAVDVRGKPVGISFKSDGGIHGIRRDRDLARLPARQSAPAVASNGTSALVTWRETTADISRIRAALLGPGGVSASEVVTLAEGDVDPPAVAFGGGVYLVAWLDRQRLVGRRFLQSGVLLDSVPFPISAPEEAGASNPAAPPSLAWNGSEFVAAWIGRIEIVTSTVSPSAIVGTAKPATRPHPRDLANYYSSHGYDQDPSLAWNGRVLLLTYTRTWYGMLEGSVWWELRTIALDRLGTPINDAPAILGDFLVKARIATDGDRFLLTAEQGTAIDVEGNLDNVGSGTVIGQWFDAGGQPLRGPFEIGKITPGFIGTPMSDVTWDGLAFIAVGRERVGDQWTIWKKRIRENGVVRESSAETDAPDRTAPAAAVAVIARRPGETVVLATDARNEVGPGTSTRLQLYEDSAFVPYFGRRRAVRR